MSDDIFATLSRDPFEITFDRLPVSAVSIEEAFRHRVPRAGFTCSVVEVNKNGVLVIHLTQACSFPNATMFTNLRRLLFSLIGAECDFGYQIGDQRWEFNEQGVPVLQELATTELVS